MEARKKALGMTVPCPYNAHMFKVTKIDAVVFYTWQPPPEERPAPKPPAEKAPTTLLSAKRFADNTLAVEIGRGRDRASITFPKTEVETFDHLMKIAKASGQATIENATLAFLIAHGGGTKTMITGFLNASGFPEATPSTVGEALSRLRDEGKIYRYPRMFKYTYYPLSLYGRIEERYVSTFMGETVYGISEATRIKILERLKFDPHLAWWNLIEPVKPTKIIAELKKPLEYEWITFTKPAPRFRAPEDFKYYGPYKAGELAKLPIATAYFIVSANYAKWLNPKKENVLEIEKIIKATYTPKQIRSFQVSLGLFVKGGE